MNKDYVKERAQREARQLEEDIASYLTGTSMRSEQGEDEAGQPREDIASYSNRKSKRSKHRRGRGRGAIRG